MGVRVDEAGDEPEAVRVALLPSLCGGSPTQSGMDRHSISSSCTVRTNSSISREHHFSLWEKICR